MRARDERDSAMSDQRHSVRLRRFLALALAVLAGFAAATSAQEAPPATPPASGAESPAQQNSAQQQPNAPARLSAQDAVAPRSTIDTLAEIKKAGKLRVGVSMIIPWAMH